MFNKIPKSILIISITVVLTFCAIGGTLAFISKGTPSVENTFTPVFVSCLVEEDFDGITKSNVRIKNTGDINAYVRATFVVMWTDNKGGVHSKSPVLGEDYTLSFGSSDWVKGSDGFYYYRNHIAPEASTDILIESISPKSEAPSGYSLTVHVAATAIQAEPTTAALEAWGVQILSDGSLIAP